MNKSDLDTIKYYSEHYNEYEPKCPIVIPSYQNRTDTILNNLKSLSHNRIILFVYDTDYPIYKQYETDNVEIVQIHEQWRSIQRKRHWIQEYLAKTDIENYIMADDDIQKAKITCFKNGKMTSKYIPLINALGILEDLHTKYSNTVSGGVSDNIQVAHPQHLYVNSYFYQVFCFNNDWVRNNPNCMFRDMQNVSEDTVIWYDCFKNNQKYYSFGNIWFECKNKKSIASTSLNIMKNLINGLRIMKHECIFHWSNTWNSWAVRFVPNSYEKMWLDIKTILDKNMPDWENLENNYNDTDFKNVFELIDKRVKSTVNKTINKSCDWNEFFV